MLNWKLNGKRLYINGEWLGNVCGTWWKSHEDGHTNALNRLLYVYMWAKDDDSARLFAGTLLATLNLSKEQLRYGIMHLDVMWAITNNGGDLPPVIRRQLQYIWSTWEKLYLYDGVDPTLKTPEEQKIDTSWWDKFVDSATLVKSSFKSK